METEKHYFKVGLFFLVAAAIFVYYLTVFGQQNQNRNLKPYVVYFDHSVSGLARGAPVKLKGITVGQVDDIRFVSAENDRIVVMADISDTAPVRTNTVASVAFQGITGATYLSLENIGPEASAAPLTIENGEKYPVIRSRTSDMELVLDNAEKLLSDKNITEVEALLPAAHDTLAEATAAFTEIKMLARELREDPSIILRGPQYQGYKVPNK